MMPDQKEILFQEQTAKGLLQVWQTKNQRWLTIDAVEQSRIDVTHKKRLISPVHHALFAAMLFTDLPKSVLLAGLGTGAIARYMSAINAGIHGVAVENNRRIPDLAEQYFDFPQNNWTVITKDIQQYNDKNRAFDFIVADIALAELTPGWLTEEKMLSHFKQKLSTAGVLAINLLVADAQSFSHQLMTIRKVFDRRTLCLSVPHHKNIIVFAFNKQPTCCSSDQLNARVTALSQLWGLDFKQMLTRLKIENPVGSGIF